MATTTPSQPDLGKPQFASHKWIEPIIVIGIMIGSLIINRHRTFTISWSLRNSPSRPDSSHEIEAEALISNGRSLSPSSINSEGKSRTCCGFAFTTPNTQRFRNTIRSQILQKFPFLIEMFYWALNYGAYSLTKAVSEKFYDGKGNGVVELAQSHGISILWFEHDSIFRFFFPLKEVDVQRFFLENGHTSAMTLLNRAYSLVHIPGTVLFLSWYYYSAPNHDTFALARRTMTLANFAAFIVFSFWPCMPPRLLPKSFGFHDTVRQDNAESVWVGGKNVNQLAAMPSLHFTYAFVIGTTFLYHTRRYRSWWKKLGLLMAGIVYPSFVILVIVATANHYYLDAVVATVTVGLSFLCNHIWFVFLPLEDWLAWILRLEKPVPTTGMIWKEKRRTREDV